VPQLDPEKLPLRGGYTLGRPVRQLGFWWIELGGENDTIHDTETLRDQLTAAALGVWDALKNNTQKEDLANWNLEWLQFLPGKRESRRYIGDHVLTENDILSEGRFEDVVAYGGWHMDDHHPAGGLKCVPLGVPATIFHECPSPYGIGYRSLYAKTIENLYLGGRVISATHAAMSSTRVMGTLMSMAQAAGTAATIALRENTAPRGVNDHIHELQQMLLADDCYLPFMAMDMPEPTASARLTVSRGDGEPLRDGVGRQVGEDPHCWTARIGDWAAYQWDQPVSLSDITLTLDSAMEKSIYFTQHYDCPGATRVPDVVPKAFTVEVEQDGQWRGLHEISDNHQRHVRLPIGCDVTGVRVTLKETWGAEQCRLYAMYVRQ
jgi:hypothetical protein